MKTYGLSGKSGTGKSYNAGELCGRMHIPAIIDDGLFIYGNSIAAGVSAKKQETRDEVILHFFKHSGVSVLMAVLSYAAVSLIPSLILSFFN